VQTITVYTLFDVTETGVVRSFKMNNLPFTTKSGITILRELEWRFARQQQSNLEVLLQVMSLRTQLHNVTMHSVVSENVNKHKFHKSFKGKHNVWSLTFDTEHIDALSSGDGPLGALCSDCNHVPMLMDLNETISTEPYSNYLDCTNANIYFTLD
jgi:hypothetical protein